MLTPTILVTWRTNNSEGECETFSDRAGADLFVQQNSLFEKMIDTTYRAIGEIIH